MKLYLDDDIFITADNSTGGMLRIEHGEIIIDFWKEHAEKITKFLNHVYGKGENDQKKEKMTRNQIRASFEKSIKGRDFSRDGNGYYVNLETGIAWVDYYYGALKRQK